ncbi:hypothetical protein BDZ94DRAFT_516074 [Collybia nuda]|uniref:F-box domain-containing protein n=1 Tax=Collybia nuda TaxID=64659 RepID=A0A9P5Y5U8_9AGAR|nr:hypothetical protein BDZ94DRAFT_516074 [Collybia nuda]
MIGMTQEGRTTIPLDDDTIDRILTYLPDFSALAAAILCSKQLNDIFQIRRKSITSAVAYNIAGPALPEALKLLRYIPTDQNVQNTGQPQKSWLEMDTIFPITKREAECLIENADVVAALEALFSSRYKDRTSRVSKLNPMESLRFRRAMYQIMLYASRFARKEHKQFLLQFSDHDLFPIYSVGVFLTEVALWIEIAEDSYLYDDFKELALAHGPKAILEAYQTCNTQNIREVMNSGIDQIPRIFQDYLTYPLYKIWDERNTRTPTRFDSHWELIIYAANDGDDTCDICGAVRGSDLYNETNWDLLCGINPTRRMNLCSYLKGNLNQNPFIRELIREEMSAMPNFTDILEEMHDLHIPLFNTWEKKDWLCLECIVNIIRAHLHLWLLERKKLTGAIIPEDCMVIIAERRHTNQAMLHV